ncbi:MAG: serine/threonine-protein kinase [Brevundimonas sp.]|uniref:serine/threonine-protein kinase n=1 Tax=Brevundimonas sp. TaxID=1871086 RepID=UPI004034406F
MPPVVPALQIGRRLGNGHFGVVYEGQDSVHGLVAVKVLSRAPFNSDDEWEEYKRGFLAEAQHLSQATHHNVVKVHHIEEMPDGLSIRFCMELCPGGSLQSRFEAGPMFLAEVRKAATDILLGLTALHLRGMLHRDIKPGNILIDRNGVAKLGDFGLVTDHLLMGYASQAGYRDHLAHEIWHGGGTSTRTDVWAVGMTLFRLLHGRTWYEEAPAPRDLVRDGGFANTLKWLPHVPKPWRRVIRKMLADNPAGRYQTAAQALEALSKLPVSPAWHATVTTELVRWEHRSKTRLNVVEWRRHSTRRHEWSAWSEPLGDGRRKTLDGSGGEVSRRAAVSGLEAYFAGW